VLSGDASLSLGRQMCLSWEFNLKRVQIARVELCHCHCRVIMWWYCEKEYAMDVVFTNLPE
jgi:hypothetical protein